MQAKAIIANGTRSFSIETIDVLPPQHDELLVEIKAAGLCHTDFDSMLFSLGTLSEYTLVHEATAVKIERDMTFPSAAIVSCGVMTGYGSVVNAAKVKPGRSVVVLGTGAWG